MVIPFWKPQHLNLQHSIRELKDPKSILNTNNKACFLLREHKKHLFTQKELESLNDLQFSNEIIENLDYKVSIEKTPLDLTTLVWLKKHIHPKNLLSQKYPKDFN